MDNKVYIVQCKNYDEIEGKFAELINLMGGIGRFAKQGEKIVLKVNLLREAKPEEAVTTQRKLRSRPNANSSKMVSGSRICLRISDTSSALGSVSAS